MMEAGGIWHQGAFTWLRCHSLPMLGCYWPDWWVQPFTAYSGLCFALVSMRPLSMTSCLAVCPVSQLALSYCRDSRQDRWLPLAFGLGRYKKPRLMTGKSTHSENHLEAAIP